MSAKPKDERLARLNALSDRLFGEAAEVGPGESEELLRMTGIDPARLQGALYRRMLEKSAKYSKAGEPLPPLLRQALLDLRPVSERSEPTVAQTARLRIRRLLEEIRNLPGPLDAGIAPVFMTAYRNRKDLSARDKKILDEVAQDLRKCIGKRKTHD